MGWESEPVDSDLYDVVAKAEERAQERAQDLANSATSAFEGRKTGHKYFSGIQFKCYSCSELIPMSKDQQGLTNLVNHQRKTGHKWAATIGVPIKGRKK